jgi:phage tail-like protein
MKRTEIIQLLPEIFRQADNPGTALSAVIDTMESLHIPDETILNSLDSLFNPRLTVDRMVPFLAHWVELEWLLTEELKYQRIDRSSSLDLLTNGLGRLRELLANGAYLIKWRGTSEGLRTFIQIALGIKNIQIEENPEDSNGNPIPYHIKITVSIDAKSYLPVLHKIIEKEKPAYTTYELAFK